MQSAIRYALINRQSAVVSTIGNPQAVNAIGNAQSPIVNLQSAIINRQSIAIA